MRERTPSRRGGAPVTLVAPGRDEVGVEMSPMLQLQRLAGNAAVSGAVAGARSLPVQTKMAMSAGALGNRTLGSLVKKIRTGEESTYSKIIRATERYHGANTALEEVALLNVILGLATYWLGSHHATSSVELDRRAKVLALLRQANAEKPRARSQLGYIQDVHRTGAADAGFRRAMHGKFDPASTTAAKEDFHDQTGFHHLSKGGRTNVPQHAAGMALGEADEAMPGSSPAAMRLMRSFGLTDAENAAIKIYTVDDYKYINHAMSGWDAGIARDLPDVAGSIGDTTDVAGAKAEGRRHGEVARAGMAKLPPFRGTVYRGMRMTFEKFGSQFKRGSVPSFTYLMSSSKNRSVAERFASPKTADPADEDRLSVMLVITSATGRDVSALSLVGDEGEVLFAPPMAFAVSSSSVVPERNKAAGGSSYFEVRLTEIAYGSVVRRP